MGDVDSGRGHACGDTGGRWKISVPSSQFRLDPETALNNKVFIKNEQMKTTQPKSWRLLVRQEVAIIRAEESRGHNGISEDRLRTA